MSLAVVHTRASHAMHAPQVLVEVHLSNGLPGLSIVGLPEKVVKESKDRVRSAILNSHFKFPSRRITINLAPVDLPKDGGRFDLPIAIGILVASQQITTNQLSQTEFVGELALSGELRPITTTLPIALAAQQAQKNLVLPQQNADEANLAKALCVLPAQTLNQVCAHLCGESLIPAYTTNSTGAPKPQHDMHEVQGHQQAKRALAIAATGSHSVLMSGPPGTGKSMLAKRFADLLPPLNEQQALEIASLRSISHGKFNCQEWRVRPFRSPHHTASAAALVGGGNPPKPGEISLAHHGVLFLDELPEFNRHVLETLREPLESGSIHLSRAAHQVEYPANFQLIAAMNPCPCGYHGDPENNCRCTSEQVQRYHARLSGPLLDRFDMNFIIQRIPTLALIQKTEQSESSADIQQRVVAARKRQISRSNCCNAALSSQQAHQFCKLQDSEQQFILQAVKQFKLSPRAYYRVLRVARSIADLADQTTITEAHLKEALSYRQWQPTV